MHREVESIHGNCCLLVFFVLVPKGKTSGMPARKQTQRKLTLRMVVHVLAEKKKKLLEIGFSLLSSHPCVVNKLVNNKLLLR